ncbi:MAG: hypothetical protein FWC33_01480 [Candidatus Bathyarchaeota archaeon]|nr:hypothetical protein [Candidatus Termiticorpusculum sp.]
MSEEDGAGLRRTLNKISFSPIDLIMFTVILVLTVAFACIIFYEKPPIPTILSFALAITTTSFALVHGIQSGQSKAEFKKSKIEYDKKINKLNGEDVRWDSVKDAVSVFPRRFKDMYPNFEPNFILAANAKGGIIAEMICNTWGRVPIYVGTMTVRDKTSDSKFVEKSFRINGRSDKWYINSDNGDDLKFYKSRKWYVSVPEHIIRLDKTLASTLKVLIVHDYSLYGSVVDDLTNCLKQIGFIHDNIGYYCLVINRQKCKNIQFYSIPKTTTDFNLPWGSSEP